VNFSKQKIAHWLTAGCVIPILITVISGCGGTQKVAKDDRADRGVRNFEKMREDFDPTALGDYDIEIEDSELSASSFDEFVFDSEKSQQDSVGIGYRVQLIQTTDPEEAKNVQRDALLRFDADVYRVFDPPFYKVRVGDFANWYDAEKLQKQAIQKGFREAWVIRTKVNLKKAYKWLDEL